MTNILYFIVVHHLAIFWILMCIFFFPRFQRWASNNVDKYPVRIFGTTFVIFVFLTYIFISSGLFI